MGSGVEQKGSVRKEPNFFRVDYDLGVSLESVRPGIAEKFVSGEKALVVRLKGNVNIHHISVEAQMVYDGGVKDPVIFTFQQFDGKGTSASYESSQFNPYNRTTWRFEVVDIIDFFQIAYNALTDSVSPEQIKSALEATFPQWDPDDAETKKAKLASELATRKYLS